MTRPITEHSKAYIKNWLKNKYANDPEFREKKKTHNEVNFQRIKARRIITITLLEKEVYSFLNTFHF